MGMVGNNKTEICALAKQMREKIYQAESEYPKIKGTTYYISNNGDDRNSGTSPEEPWATWDNFERQPLKAGDAVLFERGGIYRGYHRGCSGVTYSAYGVGAKPRLIGATENAAKLVWKETDRKNVYLCEKKFPYPIGIATFDNETKIGVSKMLGTDELKKDLDFFSDYKTGEFFLFSEKGNPSEVFFDIELGGSRPVFDNDKYNHDIIFDNIEVSLGASHGFCGASLSNILVSNCVFRYIGGGLSPSIEHLHVRYGNGVEFWESCHNIEVRNCYFTEIYDAALTFQFKGYTPEKDIEMFDINFHHNLMEKNTYSIEIFCEQPENRDLIKNVIIEDNIMLDAGYGWGMSQRPDKDTASHIKMWDHRNNAENFIVRNNILSRSRFSLVQIGAEKITSLPQFFRNVYVQELGRIVFIRNRKCTWCGQNSARKLKEIEKGCEPIMLFADDLSVTV